MPMTSGSSSSLHTTRRPMLPHGSTLYRNTLTMTTRMRKLVPQRGWKRVYLRTFSTVSGSPAS